MIGQTPKTAKKVVHAIVKIWIKEKKSTIQFKKSDLSLSFHLNREAEFSLKSHRLGEHQAELVFTTDQKIHDNNISFKKLLSPPLFFPSG